MLPIAFSLSAITAATWIDIVCATIVIILVARDAIRGLSATLAQIAALVLAFKLAFLLYPRLSSIVHAEGAAEPALGFGLTLLAAFAIFLALRFAFAKIAHVILIPPIDNILGAAAGAIKGLLLVFVVFTVVAVAARKSYSGSAFAKSRTGSRVMPVVERLLAPAGGKMPGAFNGK